MANQEDNQGSLRFPEGFFWGCATSAHQIEGGLTNDWTEWEKSPRRLADLERKQEDPLDFISGAAANSFVENNADIACLKELNANAYRFSVDWSRLEPEEGRFDQEAFGVYLDFLKKLRAAGIEPFLTLWHWPIPLWLRDQGGFENKAAVGYFERFVSEVQAVLGGEVKFWMTLNEPLVYASQSYLVGEWPPQKRKPFAALRVVKNLIACHKAAYRVLKEADPDCQVGIAKHNMYYEAGPGLFINPLLCRLGDFFWNRYFLDRIRKEQDFIGLNYYFHNYVNYGYSRQFSYEKKSDLGWGLHPEGIYHVLRELKRYGCPIYVTENGLADKGDQHRAWYIREILRNVHRAIDEGVPVKGYLHWSLIDNFEWAAGFKPRFGLYETDYKTFERRPRPSAVFYGDICKNNRL